MTKEYPRTCAEPRCPAAARLHDDHECFDDPQEVARWEERTRKRREWEARQGERDLHREAVNRRIRQVQDFGEG